MSFVGRARTVRAVAAQADPLIKRLLLQLADNYERRITPDTKDDVSQPGPPERHNMVKELAELPVNR